MKIIKNIMKLVNYINDSFIMHFFKNLLVRIVLIPLSLSVVIIMAVLVIVGVIILLVLIIIATPFIILFATFDKLSWIRVRYYYTLNSMDGLYLDRIKARNDNLAYKKYTRGKDGRPWTKEIILVSEESTNGTSIWYDHNVFDSYDSLKTSLSEEEYKRLFKKSKEE